MKRYSTEAAMKTFYTLVTEKAAWLENLVVIMDPCINPDGRDRYVNWYNQVKSTPFDSKPIANEHYEDWPGGRYNHYYFDLEPRLGMGVSKRNTTTLESIPQMVSTNSC